MREIKSFKEYIAEQEAVLEADNENAAENSTGTSTEISTDTSTDEKLAPEKEEKDTINGFSVIEKFSLNKNMASGNETPADDLDKKLRILKNTFRNLNNLIVARKFISKGQDANAEKHPLDITNGNSFYLIRSNFEEQWKARIDKARVTDEIAGIITKIQKKKALSSEEQEKYEKFIGRVNESFWSDDDLLNEGPINILKNAFRTTSELASNLGKIGSRYSAQNVLTTASKNKASKKNILGLNDEFMDKMYQEYIQKASAIIRKERTYGLTYIKSAEKKIAKFKNVKVYLKNSDSYYISDIKRDLFSALSVLTTIGNNLKTLMANYKQALNRILEELDFKNVKNTEMLSGSNAEKAKVNYNARLQSQSEKKAKDEFKASEKKAKDELKASEKEQIQQDEDEVKFAARKYYNEILNEKTNYKVGALKDLAQEIQKKDNLNENDMRGCVIGLYIFAKTRGKLIKYLDIRSSREKHSKDFFNSKYNFAVFKFRKKRNNEVLNAAVELDKDDIPTSDVSDQEASQSTGADNTNQEVKATGAKDFKNTEPPAPSNIYDYALQKAKRL